MTKRLVLPLCQESRTFPRGAALPAGTSRMAARALGERAFKGEVGEALLLVSPEAGEADSLVLLGLGPQKKLTLEVLRRALGTLARRARKEGVAELEVALDPPWLRAGLEALGWEQVGKAARIASRLGAYGFDAYKTSAKEKRRPPRIAFRSSGLPAAAHRAFQEGAAAGDVVAEAVNLVRDLANTPANDLYPENLAERARIAAREAGVSFRLLGKAELERERMGALLGVAQGSDRSPCMVVLEHKPRGPRPANGPARAGAARRGAKVPTLALVGKAITFDCGGLSIKPSKGMEEMKFDMAGGGAVLGAMTAIGRLRPPVRVVGIVPATENVIGGSAMRPGDILRSASGKTIEVVNTDAEGRLILADALHYARRFQPDYILDFATLTGACLVALGTQVSGLVSNDKGLSRLVFEAGERSGERVWELPLYEEFQEATKSQVADLKNSAGRNGGAITAAAFLSHFVGSTPWCHLDIAGTAWAERDTGPFAAGATGVGVRLICELVETLAQKTGKH
ncbi:MAG: leucyl aminopeptidase [Planctomycetes bacterium]|nr:leucyl aminopeptidase [Planctomycetota bacterium]